MIDESSTASSSVYLIIDEPKGDAETFEEEHLPACLARIDAEAVSPHVTKKGPVARGPPPDECLQWARSGS